VVVVEGISTQRNELFIAASNGCKDSTVSRVVLSLVAVNIC